MKHPNVSLIIDQLMFFSVMMLCSILFSNARPYSLGRKCVAQQAVCLYLPSCETPFFFFLSVIVPTLPLCQLWTPLPKKRKTCFDCSSFQVKERNGKCGFWLSGEVLFAINKNLKAFWGPSPHLLGVLRISLWYRKMNRNAALTRLLCNENSAARVINSGLGLPSFPAAPEYKSILFHWFCLWVIIF